MFSLIRKWESSGLTQTRFMEEYRIPKSTFFYWRKKYLGEQAVSDCSSGMIPVHIVPDTQEADQTPGNIEIVYPNGIRVVCPGSIEATRIKELIS